MENQQYIREDEIDLREYINVIIKRKKLILSIFFIGVVVAAIASLLMPKVYELSSTIQIGSIGAISVNKGDVNQIESTSNLLIKKEEIREIILNQNSLLSIIKELNLKIEPDKFKKNIKIEDIGGTNLLKIKITYPGIDTVFKINELILNPLIAKGQALYQERLSIANERVKELDAEIKSAEEDIARTQTMISGLPNTSNISQSDVSLRIVLLQNNLPNYGSNLTALRNQRNELKLSLSNAKDFKIFDAPIRPKYQVSPRKKEIVLLAGIFSLVFGVFLAFFIGFWQKGKEGGAK